LHTVSIARRRAAATAGSNIPSNTAMMAITTSSSMTETARRFDMVRAFPELCPFSPSNQRLKLTGAAVLVFRASTSSQAAPAA
jgi:hypothetical protein